MKSLIHQAQVYYRLGIHSCLMIAHYRLRKKFGYFIGKDSINKKMKEFTKLPDFHSLSATVSFYFNARIPMNEINWHEDRINGICISDHDHWSKINFFSDRCFDIKNIWELSRFYFAPELAYKYCLTHNCKYSKMLKVLWEDWTNSNPYSYGANWLCGQEVSLRLINVVLSSQLIGLKKDEIFKKEILVQHCERIYQTTYYAKSQKNNHALSEAIGLFVGALYLKKNYGEHKNLKKYQKKGYNLLCWCFDNLIMSDGTFSQYSVNYHRLALNLITILFMLIRSWSIKIPLDWINKYDLMIKWLTCFVDPVNGMAANIGANDGAMLLNVGNTDYQDMGYSIIFAKTILSILSDDKTISSIFYTFKKVNEKNILKDACEQVSISRQLRSGGFVRLSGKDSWAIFRYPKFKFRPSQCDIMHVDLWVKGVNVLLDSGTYSYNTTDELQNYFKSVTAHNTVQIDDLEQMRSASRFLYLDWPKVKNIVSKSNKNGNITSFSCSYKHYSRAIHHRKIEVNDNGWIITDTISGLKRKANLFWHMPYTKGQLCDKHYENELITLSIDCDQTNFDVTIKDCWISKYYQTKEKALVIAVSCENIHECQFITTVKVK